MYFVAPRPFCRYRRHAEAGIPESLLDFASFTEDSMARRPSPAAQPAGSCGSFQRCSSRTSSHALGPGAGAARGAAQLGRRHHQTGGLRDAAEGTGRRRARAAAFERRRSPISAPTRNGSSTKSVTARSSMKTFSKPFHELGGLFVDYKANRARALTIRNNVGIQFISAADGSKKPMQLPAGARVSNATWSPDSSGVAFFVHGDDATHIWFADVATGKARQLTKTPVLATLVIDLRVHRRRQARSPFVQVPESRAPMPAAPVGADRADGQARRHR